MAAVYAAPRGAHRKRVRSRRIRIALLVPALSILLAAGMTAAVMRIAAGPEQAVREAIEAQLGSGGYSASLAEFYAQRDDRPLWLTVSGTPPFWRRLALGPDAARVIRLAAHNGIGGAAAAARALDQARSGDPAALARSDLMTSAALAGYVRSLAPSGPEPLAFIDPELARPSDDGDVLRQATSAASLTQYVEAVGEVNPVYRDLAAGLDQYRRTWSKLPQVRIADGPRLQTGDRDARTAVLRKRLGVAEPAADPALFDATLAQALRRFQAAHGLTDTGELDSATVAALNAGPARFEQLIEANLKRARALPPVLARRFILVNVAARELWVYEDGRPKHAMRVVVGTREEPTPEMVGLLRYLVFNPYWNIPVDIVRTSIAPRVLKEGPGYLQRAHLEVLSGWDEAPSTLNPAQVDWAGVSQGWQELRVRQRPGGDNMMGQVKFMAPNKLGIYLHDTPNKAAFQDPQRLLSAGCVRLEFAQALTRWLLGAAPDVRAMGPDQAVFLDQPVPLYITYLTAAPSPGGVVFFRDVYGKDAAAPVPGIGR